MTFPEMSEFAIRVSELRKQGPHKIDCRLSGEANEIFASDLGLIDLRKVRLSGVLQPLGKRDWELQATLGATVVQSCVATLAPVTTRIDIAVSRKFLHDFPDEAEPEQEMPEDDSSEPLGQWIDPGAVLAEALSLALPLYPRSDDAAEIELRVTEPGKTAMSDDDAKPFAGLAGLRAQLEDQGDP